MNLSSLSSQLNMSIQDLRLKAKEKGYFISPKANKVDNYVARKMVEAYGPKPNPSTSSGSGAKPQKVKLPGFIKVRDFAVLLNLPVTKVITVLINNGVMASINEEVDFDTASIVAQELGFEVETEVDTAVAEYGLGFLQE